MHNTLKQQAKWINNHQEQEVNELIFPLTLPCKGGLNGNGFQYVIGVLRDLQI
jgi:hypothetical protein